MSFGQIIRKLRHEADMTQEHLAELLSISPQAISRWETDAAMPDISLLPALANLFDVTCDHLLGMDTYQRDARKAEFDEAYKDYWKKDDKEDNYRIAAQAVAEYPGNMEYLEWLASAEFYMAFLRDEPAYHQWLDKAVFHYKIVLDHCTDQKLRDKALHGIVLTLYHNSKKAEAKEYAMQQEDEEKRDELLLWCLEGHEKTKLSQKILKRKFNAFLLQIPLGQSRMEAYDIVERILHTIFPDGNFLYHHNTLQYNYIHKAFYWCRQKCYDKVIEELKNAKYHAEQMMMFRAKKTYHYTSPLFDCLEGENTESDCVTTDLEDFIHCLENNQCFDPLRDSDEFRKLLEA